MVAFHRALCACLLLFGALDCSSSAGLHTSPGLPGDWFPCDNADCSEVSDDGYRFLADGTALHVDGRHALVSAAPLCIELDGSAGTYQFDGSTFTLEGVTWRAELSGDLLTIYDVPWEDSEGSSGFTTARLRRVPTYEGAPCPRR